MPQNLFKFCDTLRIFKLYNQNATSKMRWQIVQLGSLLCMSFVSQVSQKHFPSAKLVFEVIFLHIFWKDFLTLLGSWEKENLYLTQQYYQQIWLSSRLHLRFEFQVHKSNFRITFRCLKFSKKNSKKWLKQRFDL